MASFGAAYLALAPRVLPAHPSRGVADYPKVKFLLGFGLAMPIITVANRVVTTGHLLPRENYGTTWESNFLSVENNRAVGGVSYVIDQLYSKVWIYPMMALGIASGIILALLIVQRRYRLIALTPLVPAVLMVLNGGTRSGIALTFFVSLCVADWLAGPLKWRWLATFGFLGLIFFNLFGVYRGVQDRSLDEAIELTVEGFQDRGDVDSGSAEGTITLLKEHYGISYVDATGTQLGAEFILQQFLWIVPTQIIPEKRSWFDTSEWLSRELLGTDNARAGGGAAGSMIIDGYFVATELGEVALGLILGAIYGLTIRLLLLPDRHLAGVPFWRVALSLTLAHHCILFVRSNLGALVVAVFYFVVLPVIAVLALRSLMRRDNPWLRPVRLLGLEG